MPALENNGGDVLARGGVRFTFKPAGTKKTQKEWDDMFSDFDPVSYLNKEPENVKTIKANSYGGFDGDGS